MHRVLYVNFSIFRKFRTYLKKILYPPLSMTMPSNQTIASNHSFSQQNNDYCTVIRDMYGSVETNTKIALVTVFSLTGFMGVLFNVVLVIAIHKTNQLAVQSIRLFRLLSILDTFNSIINFFHLRIMLLANKSSCFLYYALNYLVFFAMYNSFAMVVVVAIDRLMHVRYLQNYSRVFTSLRFKLTIGVFMILALYQSCATTYSNIAEGPRKGGKYTIQLNVIFFFAIIFFYTSSLVILKKHSQSSVVTNLSNSTRNILKITGLYFYFYIINVSVPLLYQIVGNWTGLLLKLDENGKSVAGIVIYNMPAFIGAVNAVAFLRINKKCRRWVGSFLQNGVGVDEHNNDRNDVHVNPINLVKQPERK